MGQNEGFTIDFLDHVAIRVQDVEASVEWYARVLGLEKYQLPEWGDYPVFMLSGKSGIAIFPAKTEDSVVNLHSKNTKIDHFAFQVTKENFEKAKQRYTELGLDFNIQDHHYFHSIYTRDLDGHTVELTTLVSSQPSPVVPSFVLFSLYFPEKSSRSWRYAQIFQVVQEKNNDNFYVI